MKRTSTPVIRVPEPTAETDADKRIYIGENKFKEPLRDILEVPHSLKLVVPSLVHHFPDLIQFLRHDARKYPKLVIVEQSPHPYPFLEVYNIELKLLYEIDLTFKRRAHLNKLMRDYDQLPLDSLERLCPPNVTQQKLLEDANRQMNYWGNISL